MHGSLIRTFMYNMRLIQLKPLKTLQSMSTKWINRFERNDYRKLPFFYR